jgi:hypothetical protein
MEVGYGVGRILMSMVGNDNQMDGIAKHVDEWANHGVDDIEEKWFPDPRWCWFDGDQCAVFLDLEVGNLRAFGVVKPTWSLANE